MASRCGPPKCRASISCWKLGAVTESVTVSASASLVNTENVVSAYVLPADVLKESPGVMKRTVYLLQYMPGIVGVLGQAGFHITGQAQNDIGATLDGITSKSPYTGDCEPGGWRGPRQHGRDGRGQGAHHRRLRRIRTHRRRVDEDGLQVGHQLAAWVL